MSNCTCNNPESMVGVITCGNCKGQYNRKLDHMEIMGNCPEHRGNVAICCGGPPYLCRSCKANGYKIKLDTSADAGWMSPFKIVKRTGEGSSSDSDEDSLPEDTYEPVCSCNDTSQQTEVSCGNCDETWYEEMAHYERVSNCSIHRNSIAICGGKLPQLCSQCITDGYKIVAESCGFFPTFKIVKEASKS
jgi:hypothetical protein